MKQPITIKDARAAMALQTWWAIIFIQPVARHLVVYIVNRTWLTANHITFASIGFRLITVICFLQSSRWVMVIGALSYYCSYICDCSDGPVARINRQASELGRYLDHVADFIGDILILTTLSYTCGIFGSFLYFSILFMHVAECFISYLAGFAIEQNTHADSRFFLFKYFNRYRQWWFSKNIKSFFSFPDYTAFVFVFSVLFNKPLSGIQAGFWILLVICFYTILSVFTSLHTQHNLFP